MPVSLTSDLARFVSGLSFQDLPQAVRDQIRIAFADCLAVAIAGAGEPAPMLVCKVLPTSTADEATVFGSGLRTGAIDAALINGTAAHALDFDDDAQRGGHISAVLVPAILAEAEAVGACGAQMMAAYAAGFETISELIWRDPGQHHEKGWHPTGVFGSVGAAAACASLRGLDIDQTVMALGIAASQSAGVIANVGSMTKPLHAGKAASNGVLAARLAGAGFTAAADVFEHAPGFLKAISPGGHIDLDAPVCAGARWRIIEGNRIGVKQYPLCYYTHRAIDGTIDLIQAHAPDPAQIERITVSLSPRNATILRYHAPQTGLEAKFSIEFAVASTLIAGRPGLSELTDAFVRRPDVQALMRRVEVRHEKREDPRYPGYALHDQVALSMRDGRHIEGPKVNRVRGGWDLPIAAESLWQKFSDCMTHGGIEESRPLFEMIMALDDLENARDLAARLARHGISGAIGSVCATTET